LATPDLGGSPPIVEYRFRVSTNFDAAPTVIQTVPRRGFRSPSAVDNGYNDARFKGKVRFLFNPIDYIASGIVDTSPFFIAMATRPLNGVFGTFSSQHMIVPYDSSSDPLIVLNGDAPMAASITGSLEIQLPRIVDELIVKNVDAANLHLAFNSGGPEYQINPSTVLELADISASQIFVRGEGAAVTFNAIGALQNSSIK
jgi:hypothetical protein